ncbi:MAG TPA: GrpB family protein [Usitatibacter sp.]|nr:GrpB family protein [Usitatibacter sp.]
MTRVRLVPYDEGWRGEFQRLAGAIRSALGERVLRIDHIGSTSVPGLTSKNVIDIQATVAALEPDSLSGSLARLGYECTAPDGRDHVPPGGSSDEADWRKAFFLLASPERRVHLHVRVAGAANQRYALLFRDYLRAHPAAAAAYANLKRKLSEIDPPLDPDEYADVKDPACDLVIVAAEDWADRTGWKPAPSDA